MPGQRIDWRRAAHPTGPISKAQEISPASAREDLQVLQEIDDRREAERQELIDQQKLLPKTKRSRASKIALLFKKPQTEQELALEKLLSSPLIKEHRFKRRTFGDVSQIGFGCRKLKMRLIFGPTAEGNILVSPGRRVGFEKVSIKLPDRPFTHAEGELLRSLVVDVIAEQLAAKESENV